MQNQDEAMSFLSAFIDKINTQDNRGTGFPYLYVVQSLVFDRVEPDRDNITAIQREDAHLIDGMYNLYRYEDQAWFFTEDGADAHIRMNAHNYRKPKTFVKHCFRSPEIENLLKAVSIVSGRKILER